MAWRNQNYRNENETGGVWEDEDGNLYSEPALQEMFGAKFATQPGGEEDQEASDDVSGSTPKGEPMDMTGDAAPDASSQGKQGQASPGKAQTPNEKAPSQDEIVAYIRQQADAYGMPQALALGLVNKESHFDQGLTGPVGEVGLCQINLNHGGETHKDSSGNKFTLDISRASTDWQYNVRAGLSLLKESYNFAQQNKPEDAIAATYARYNGQRKWKYYPVRNSPVHYHVYGQTIVRNGNQIYVEGYLDFYHKWGGK